MRGSAILLREVKEFAKTATKGKPCEWLQPDGSRLPALFVIDRSLAHFSVEVDESLSPHRDDGSARTEPEKRRVVSLWTAETLG